MTAWDGMTADWVGALRALFVLSLYLLGPGYVLGRFSGLLGFAAAGLVERIAIAVCFSTATVPLLAAWGGRGSLNVTAWVLGAIGALGLLLALWDASGPLKLERSGLSLALALAGIWTLVSIFSVSDLAVGGKLYFSSMALDHGVRVGMVNSLAHQGQLPPIDPFLRPDLEIPLGYHYFWFLTSSLASRLSGDWVTARGALHGGVVWAGFGLISILFLWLRRMTGATVRRCVGAAFLTLAISGLDLLVFAVWGWKEGTIAPAPSMMWWNGDQIAAWVELLLYAPHCAASMVAGATGLLLLCRRGERLGALGFLIAGAGFAATAGLAIYVCFGLVVALGFWWIWLLVGRHWEEAKRLGLAGGIALLMALPYLLEMKAAASGAPFAQFGLRVGALPYRLLGDAVPPLLRLPFDVPTTLLFEAGFLAWAWYAWRKQEPKHPDGALLRTLLWASVASTLFLRSDAVGTNDLGMRAVIPGHFALTLAAGLVFVRGHKIGPWPLLLLSVGLIGTGAQLTLLRVATLLPERGVRVGYWEFADGAKLGALTRDTRAAYAAVSKLGSPTSLVQHNPGIDQDYFSGLYNTQRVNLRGQYQLRYSLRHKELIERESAYWEPVFAGRHAPPKRVGERYFVLLKETDKGAWGGGSWAKDWVPVFASETVRVYAVE